jgi:Flp pilus assembly protein TadB
MKEFISKILKIQFNRDNNYYSGLFLMVLGIASIFWYLKFDLFEPLAFLITFLVIGWGFVLVWKSDNDLRFQQAQQQINELEELIIDQHRPISRHLRKYRIRRSKNY